MPTSRTTPGTPERDGEEQAEAAAIEAAASCVGVSLAPGQAEAIARHGGRVRAAATTQNLTRILDPDDMRVRHVLDSLMPLSVWPEAVQGAGPALDLGSGAGYPGVPLAVAGAAPTVTLLDATRKKADFLAAATSDLVCPGAVRVEWGRAESVRDRIGPQARVWTRAVGPLCVLVEVGLSLLGPGGVLVAWKGPEAEGEEAALGDAVCRALGGECLGVRPYALPFGAGKRALYAYRRGTAPLPRGVPRAPATIRRRPWLNA